jgi:hypothetical protein
MVGTTQPLCLLRQKPKGVVIRHNESAEDEKSERLVAFLGLDGKTISSAPSSRRGTIFLDIPFYRTRLPDTAFLSFRDLHLPFVQCLLSFAGELDQASVCC